MLGLVSSLEHFLQSPVLLLFELFRVLPKGHHGAVGRYPENDIAVWRPSASTSKKSPCELTISGRSEDLAIGAESHNVDRGSML